MSVDGCSVSNNAKMMSEFLADHANTVLAQTSEAAAINTEAEMKQAAAALKEEESAAPSSSKAADDGDPPELVCGAHDTHGADPDASLAALVKEDSLWGCRWSLQSAPMPCSSCWTWDSPGTGKPRRMCHEEHTQCMRGRGAAQPAVLRRAVRALHSTGTGNVEQAIAWIEEHEQDTDADAPLLLPKARPPTELPPLSGAPSLQGPCTALEELGMLLGLLQRQ